MRAQIFEHELPDFNGDLENVIAHAEYDEPDTTVGIWGGWFVTYVELPSGIQLDRDFLERVMPDQLKKLDAHADEVAQAEAEYEWERTHEHDVLDEEV